jgi:RNA polymerase sigma-70 factor (ECF subfamily)
LPRDQSPHSAKPANTRDTATEDAIADPSFNWEDWWTEQYEKNLMDAALEKVKTKASPKQWQMFDCYSLKKWPIKKVTQTLEVSATHVYVANHRVTAQIKKEIKKLQEERF